MRTYVGTFIVIFVNAVIVSGLALLHEALLDLLSAEG